MVTPLGAKLCRPSEAWRGILPSLQRGAFTKEDGEPIVDDSHMPSGILEPGEHIDRVDADFRHGVAAFHDE